MKYLPDHLAIELSGLSVNDALYKQIINDLGDENGHFIFKRRNDNRYVAVVQGYFILCSRRLVEEYNFNDILNFAGELTFFRFRSSKGYESRLGVPKKITLGRPL